jgi:hypothetical protein
LNNVVLDKHWTLAIKWECCVNEFQRLANNDLYHSHETQLHTNSKAVVLFKIGSHSLTIAESSQESRTVCLARQQVWTMHVLHFHPTWGSSQQPQQK